MSHFSFLSALEKRRNKLRAYAFYTFLSHTQWYILFSLQCGPRELKMIRYNFNQFNFPCRK